MGRRLKIQEIHDQIFDAARPGARFEGFERGGEIFDQNDLLSSAMPQCLAVIEAGSQGRVDLIDDAASLIEPLAAAMRSGVVRVIIEAVSREFRVAKTEALEGKGLASRRRDPADLGTTGSAPFTRRASSLRSGVISTRTSAEARWTNVAGFRAR